MSKNDFNFAVDVVASAFNSTERKMGRTNEDFEGMEPFEVWVRRAAWNAVLDLRNEGVL